MGKYEEALARAKELHESGNALTKLQMEIVFPVLKESEDERIRKEIIESIKCNMSVVHMEQCLAWLEKQKEQKWSPSEGEMRVLYKLCYISDQITDEDDTDLTRLYQDLKREYFNGHSFENMFSRENQKEQKPVDLYEMLVHKEPYIAPVPTPIVADEQQPAEWSEKHIADIFEKVGLAKIVREQGNDDLTNALQDAMLELSKSGNAEWSEEDAHNLSQFIEKLAKTYEFNLPNRGYDIFGFAKDILKYLRINHGKVEWDEEDEAKKERLISIVKRALHGNEHPLLNDNGATELITWLKSLRPQPIQNKFDEAMHVADKFEEGYKAGVYDTKAKSWKPSEEQMSALKHFIGPSVNGAIVAELYDDLKNYFSL